MSLRLPACEGLRGPGTGRSCRADRFPVSSPEAILEERGAPRSQVWLWPFPSGLHGSWVLEFGLQKEGGGQASEASGSARRERVSPPAATAAAALRSAGTPVWGLQPSCGPAGRLGVAARSGDARCHPARSPLPEPREDRRAAA